MRVYVHIHTGAKYDPRLRPWYLSASNGPKNVIFILDVSGSMSQNGRLESMKKAAIEMIDSLSFADYIGVVTFSSKAQTLYNLKFLAPAQSRFRDKLKSLVSELATSRASVAQLVRARDCQSLGRRFDSV